MSERVEAQWLIKVGESKRKRLQLRGEPASDGTGVVVIDVFLSVKLSEFRDRVVLEPIESECLRTDAVINDGDSRAARDQPKVSVLTGPSGAIRTEPREPAGKCGCLGRHRMSDPRENGEHRLARRRAKLALALGRLTFDDRKKL